MSAEGIGVHWRSGELFLFFFPPLVPGRVGEPLSKWENSPSDALLNRGADPSRAVTTAPKTMCNLREKHAHSRAHSRKLLHSCVHSFPVMEALLCVWPQGDRSAHLPFFLGGLTLLFGNQWENMTQSGRPQEPQVFPCCSFSV